MSYGFCSFRFIDRCEMYGQALQSHHVTEPLKADWTRLIRYKWHINDITLSHPIAYKCLRIRVETALTCVSLEGSGFLFGGCSLKKAKMR